ncbi:MAG TPA: helix-turn-helix domain-containing protein [Roseomonas sp.]|jgi:hypothetical protein
MDDIQGALRIPHSPSVDTGAPPSGPPGAIDYAASPTLAAIRTVAGEAAALQLVAGCGGTWVHLPMRLAPDAALVRLVGADAAARILAHFGAGARLCIPTGRGHGHGRRLDHREMVRLKREEGWSARRLAQAFGCSDRQVWKILAAAPPAP